ncbi:hypothetical protein [Streptomyces sp. NPDC021562]|uniref:hypothetical protein n=1 Tax=Streptomyces sp. NPDC021562 TaxID=3155121 RepID=UPI0033D0193F
MFAGSAVADFQTKGLVEFTLLLFREQGDVDIQIRERVKQSGVVGLGHSLGDFESGQLFRQSLALSSEERVLLTDSVTEFPLVIRASRVVRLKVVGAVRQRLDEAMSAVLNGGDGLVQGIALPGDAFGGSVHAELCEFKLRLEMRTAVGAEDAGGEEIRDGLEQDLFSDPQAFGVGSKPRAASVFVRIELAGVIRDLMTHFPEHFPVAQGARDVRPQDVGPTGFRMAVLPGGGA